MALIVYQIKNLYNFVKSSENLLSGKSKQTNIEYKFNVI